ncbi:hypothetical protein CsSME_00009744 [Camellia sinensis var. sinensis]
MSRWEGRESDLRGHRSKFDREPSTKKSKNQQGVENQPLRGPLATLIWIVVAIQIGIRSTINGCKTLCPLRPHQHPVLR